MIIKSLNKNKAVGNSQFANEMIKLTVDSCAMFITNLIETMINYHHIPKGFNIGIIRFLVKDAKKPSNDPNNIRPLTISDVLAVIYMKIWLAINTFKRDK